MARNQEKAQALLNKFTSFKKKMKYKNNKNFMIEKKKNLYLLEIYKKSKNKLKSLILILQLIHLNKNIEEKKKLLNHFKSELKNLTKIKNFHPKNSLDLSINYNIQTLSNNIFLIINSYINPILSC
uniref:Uncharacterized protein n=1 Tax=Lotharella vacuolata TaxID=74820 RepID=A0A0H5BKZ5_9EUKA|nr:hypothetical protein [Lotharella vacuolata]